MSGTVMTLWSKQLISSDAALDVNVPSFRYEQLLLDCSVEELAKMQPMAYVPPKNETDMLPVEHLNDANNNQSKGKIASFSSDSSAIPSNFRKRWRRMC